MFGLTIAAVGPGILKMGRDEKGLIVHTLLKQVPLCPMIGKRGRNLLVIWHEFLILVRELSRPRL